jgi:type IV pilus assembly protein PilW
VNRWSIGVTSPANPVLQRIGVIPVNGVLPASREVAEGVVNLQLQYGYDQDGDGLISATEWFDSDASNAPDLGGATVDWTRLLAVRYAILARSRHFEPAPFSAANPVWAGGAFAMTDVGGSADTSPDSPANWRSYRYSVSEGVVPMRNVLWGKNQ